MRRFNTVADPRPGGTRLKHWHQGWKSGLHPYWCQKNAGRQTIRDSRLMSLGRWQDAALDSGLSNHAVRYVILLCMTQQACSPWEALRMVRNYAMIYNTWPAPRTMERLREYEKREQHREYELRADAGMDIY